MAGLPITLVALAAGIAWLILAFSWRALTTNPRGDVETGVAWHAMRLYVRLVHRLRVEGLENIPAWLPGEPPPGPLVVVANHTAGIDPLLIQSCCVFEIRWMMLSSMMVPGFDPLWRWIDSIPVGGTVPGSQSARAGIKHLQDGGVLGIFPEGGIERPSQTILPFEPGVGLLISKTDARVLPIIVDGTPYAPSAFGSLIRRSRSRLRFLPIRSFAGGGRGAKQIVDDLRSTFLTETGWPASS